MALKIRTRRLIDVPTSQRTNLMSSTMALVDAVVEEAMVRLRSDEATGRADRKSRIFHRHTSDVTKLRGAWDQKCNEKCLYVDWVEDGEDQ